MKHFKFFLALVITLMTGASAWANNGDVFTATVDGVEITFSVASEDNLTARVGTVSNAIAIPTSTEGVVTIPQQVSRTVGDETRTYTVTSLGYNAFSNCTKITEVILPASITTLNRSSFSGCTSLTTVTFPTNSELTFIYSDCFKGCTSLTDLTLPSTVKTIDQYAFRNCSALTSINIPASVTTITSGAFAGCISLSEIHITDISAWCNIWDDGFVLDSSPFYACFKNGGETALFLNGEKVVNLVMPEGTTEIKKGPFFYNTAIQSVTIPSTVTSIESGSFFYRDDNQNVNCPNLRKVIMNAASLVQRNNTNYQMNYYFGTNNITEFVLPEGITYIGYYTFSQMGSLETVNIPSTVTTIQKYAFDRTGLTSLTLPSRLTTIEQNAFYNCDGITSVEFPSSLKTIGQEAFYDCDGITSVEFPSGLTSIGQRAFQGCSSLASVTLPTTMSSLNIGVFSGCTALTFITIPEGFTSIGESAFNTCEGLKEVNLPSTLTSIGLYAFQDCHELESITIPAKVSSFGRYAFYNCPKLNEVTIQRETPPSQTNTPVFRTPGDGEIVTLKVPMGCESAYATNYAQYFTNIIGLPMPGQIITCDGIPYKILTSPEGETPGTLMLGTGSYNQPAYNSSASGEITVPETVTYTSGDNTYNFTVTTLGGYAFYNCYNVTRINLPATITEIQNYAVSDCSGLQRLYLASPTPNTYIEDYAFSGGNSESLLVVPEGSKTAYQNSVWSNWFQYIKEVGHETEWLPGDIFYVDVMLGLDCCPTVPFMILTPANGDTPGTVQIGNRDYANTQPLEEDEPNPSIFEKGDWCPPAITIPESVKFNGKTYTVTSIGAYAFSTMSSSYDNSKIELPSTITTIGYKAFNYGCWVNDFCVYNETVPTLIMGDDPDDEYPAPFGWSFKEATNLIVPDGCLSAYSSWAPYFKNIVETPKPVVICGVEYKQNADIFGDGTAVLTWENEESGIIKGGDYNDDESVPVLTLNNATINYSGNGPAIEVNTFARFYIRVRGTNTITAANATTVISIGTNKGVDLSQTSLIFLNDDASTNQGGGSNPGGGEMMSAPRRRTAGTRSGSNLLSTLTITNNTSGGDGAYVYRGSFNVQECDVEINADKYGLIFGVEESGGNEGPVAPTKAPYRKTNNGPKKVVSPNGPVDADEYSGWLNVYEGSGLTLNGNTAALWGAIGYQSGEYEYVPGYLQNVFLMETDMADYNVPEGYIAYGPEFYSAAYNEEECLGSYYYGAIDNNNDNDFDGPYLCKHLKFGSDFFIATTDEGIRMRFKVLDENVQTCQVGVFNEQTGPIIAVDQDTYGPVTIPTTANGYQVTTICEGAFYQCSSITSIGIPASVTSIGQYAFNGCNNLQTVTCNATTPPTLGENVFTCSDAVLYVPKTVVEAYLDSPWANYFTIKPIGDQGYVFTAKIPGDVVLTFMVGEVDENGAYVQVGYGTDNGNGIVSIPNNWDGNLTIPATVSDAGGNEYTVLAIGQGAFSNTDGLNTLTFSEGIVYIGEGAFQNCYYLSTVSLPSTLGYVDSYAFYYCNGLSEVYLYNNNTENIPTLGNNSVFYSNDSSPVLFVDDDCVEAYAESAWSNYFNQILGMSQRPFTALTPEGVALKYYFINGPDNTTWVQLGSGQGSAVATTPNNWDGSLTVPAKVTNGSGQEYNVIGICDKALYQWNDLRSVTISEGIPYIGSATAGWGAFEGDNNLETVYLPSTTVSLAEWCFNSCSNIKEVYVFAEDAPSLQNYAFSCSNATLYVPAGCMETYQASDWRNYFSEIVEMDQQVVEPGDVNGDQSINVSDVTALVSIILNSGEYSTAADVNKDGVINVSDVTALVSIILNN